MTFLGLDLGTSGLRALLVRDDGAPIGSAEAGYPVAYPHPGWSEQDPADWTRAMDKVAAELRASHPADWAALKGIAVAGHMHGATLLDAEGKVLRPCILWNDTRSHRQAAELDAKPGARDLSGNIVFPGFTAPKLLWVRNKEPEVFAMVAKVLLPAAYLNLHLTGNAVGDLSDGAGTAWLDTGARAWSEDLLSMGAMRLDQMPRLVEGSEKAGELRADLLEAWGLSGPVIVAGGAADNAAAACGIGALAEGQGFVSLGTSGVVLLARDGYSPDADRAVHTFCHAVPARWYQMGVMLSATASMNWLCSITGQDAGTLAAEVEGPLQVPGSALFLPYLSGERTPHNDANIRGGFAGLSAGTARADLTRAVMEGVAFGLRDCTAAMGAVGQGGPLHIIGGGSRSDYWCHLLATVLERPMLRPKGGEFGGAMGAARLARCAVTGEDPEAVMAPPAETQRFDPQPDLFPAFRAAHERFRSALPFLKDQAAQTRA